MGLHRFLICALIVAGCGGSDEHVPDDAAVIDAGVDGPPAIDASPDAAPGVLCERVDQECPVPAQVCCDQEPGPDTCIDMGTTCNGVPLACDGPEDCPTGEECCLFDGQDSRCLTAGVCGTTGALSEPMCHGDDDCANGFSCCGLTPGPQIDLYSVCRAGACPL